MAYLSALIVAGASLLALVVMITALRGPVRRFRAALAGYRARLDAGSSLLQAGRAELRSQLDHVRSRDRQEPAGTIGSLGETEERNG